MHKSCTNVCDVTKPNVMLSTVRNSNSIKTMEAKIFMPNFDVSALAMCCIMLCFQNSDIFYLYNQ